MIFWGQKKIKIHGGDFKKRDVLIQLLYSAEKPFLVSTEDIKADNGLIEIKRAIDVANGGTPNVGQII